MKKYFVSFLLFIFMSSVFSRTFFLTYAVTRYVDTCSPENIAYKKASKIWELDIRRAVDNFITSIVINMFASSIGTNPDRVMACQNYLRGEIAALFPDMDLEGITDTCPEPEAGVCETLAAEMGKGSGAYSGNNDIVVSGINSSLLGFGNLMENFAVREPLPVNLAYSWNQTISKIPFANKALAATDPSENLPIVKASLEVWKFSRNIALGLISVVLLYTGIMIVMRKKVNQQLIVGVQYAIPKILIGVVLIIFSYAIGALITSVSWGLFRGSFAMLFREVFSGSPEIAEFPSGLLLLAVIVLILQLAGGGAFYIALVLVMAMVLMILKIVVYFKALLIYIKMVFSILTAPLEFAIGTIPGSEERITDWFKRMAKYGITIFAMGLMIPLTLYLSLSVLVAYSSGAGAEMGGWGVVMALLSPMVIVLFGFSLALGMENKIDLMFFGAKKKR